MPKRLIGRAAISFVAVCISACGDSEGVKLGSCYHDGSGQALGDCVHDSQVALGVMTFRDGEAKRAIAERLRDPASARIDSWDVFMGEGVPVLCGQVSGKNGFGGYGESVSFIYSRAIGAVMRADFSSNGEWQKTRTRLCSLPKAAPVAAIRREARPDQGGTEAPSQPPAAAEPFSVSFDNYDAGGRKGGNLHVWNSEAVEYEGCSISLSEAAKADRWSLPNPTVIDGAAGGSRGHRSYPTFVFRGRLGQTPPSPALVTGVEIRCSAPRISQTFDGWIS